MEQKEWKNWCRLCGEQNGSDINMNLKFENAETLDMAIQKYFGITLTNENTSCNKICMVCHDTITSIIKYNTHISKVNEMFLELESSIDKKFNIKSIRKRYGLNNQSSDVNHSVVKLKKTVILNAVGDSHTRTRNRSPSSESSKSFLKTERGDVNETDFIEQVTNTFDTEKFDISLNNDRSKDQNCLPDHDLSDLEEKKFKCPKCEKPFKLKRYVVDHVRRVHKKDKPFVCDICGAAFEIKRNLIDHDLTHPGERKYKCTKCDKAFKNKRDLKTHMVIHDDTGCICQICGVKLSTKKILRIHMLVHSDKNKYKCDFCLKEFKRSNAYKNHLILHTGLKPYECPFCNLTFANGSNCRKHKRTVHPAELAIQESKGQKFSRTMPSIKQLNELALENAL